MRTRLFDVGLEDTAYPFLLFISQAEIVLKSGRLRIYDENCHGRVLGAGQAFVERPNELMNVRNKSSKRATAYLTILSPAGALPREDGPKPNPSCSVP